MLSVLFLCHWYPPVSGHFIRQVARAVSPHARVYVMVVIPDSKGGLCSSDMTFEEETNQRINTLRLSCPHLQQRNFAAGLLNLAFYQLAVIRGLIFFSRRKIRFDLIHVHVLTRAAVVPFLLKLITGKPYIITEYWTRYLDGHSGYHGWFRKRLTTVIARYADAVTAISADLKRAMEKNGIRNVDFRVIPPAVDTELFTPVAPVSGREKKRLIHISTFSDQAKNVKGIMKVIGRLAQRRNDFECFMVGGEEPFTAQAIAFARELGLYEKYVFFRGVKFGEEFAAEIRDSDFLVMFSHYETFSMVIQESLSCGKPVVASATGPLPELVGKDSGILVQPGNEDELLEALDFMLNHYQEYHPQRMHEAVRNSFGFGVACKANARLYQQVLDG